MRSVIRRTQQATTPTSTAGREVEMKGCAELPDNGNETAGGRLAPAGHCLVRFPSPTG
ncbi:hypothetical protein CSB92_1377 [Pseudomonas aeruginosa]|nr:hypothetical protein CSC30_2555 [Pseudomonas aeruginosa]AWF63403.1 hypothetical protein CSC27_5163 [Pseudomonas aeruginosa]AZP62665.1 Uncharacterized protein PA1840_5477 [Pseudomonas aeruginosa]PRW14851.1 hypothetical protein CSB92_1377 [Pseudomonas aeruginosa]QJE82330.1 Uncharacterized protein PA52Ts2_0925 [Pseudomonas aeruginosa]